MPDRQITDEDAAAIGAATAAALKDGPDTRIADWRAAMNRALHSRPATSRQERFAARLFGGKPAAAPTPPTPEVEAAQREAEAARQEADVAQAEQKGALRARLAAARKARGE